MSAWKNGRMRVIVASNVLCAAAFAARMLPVRAEPEGVLGQHMALLDRNAKAFAARNGEALANDLTEDYVRLGLLGGRKSRNQELAELQRLFQRAGHPREASQATRLTVTGGDATHPTVATTLVQTKRSADVAGADGKPHAMTWETVDTEERILTPTGWKCRKRVELKNRISRDGGPYLPDPSPDAVSAREAIQRAYDDLARACNAGDENALRAMLPAAFQGRQIDGPTLTAAQWITEVERRRKEAWTSDASYAITGISVDTQRAIVGCQRTLLRQTPDKEGVIRTIRETDSSRDTWEKTPRGWSLQKSEALLEERDIVQPVVASGWD